MTQNAEFYGKYSKLRNASWQFLVDFQIAQLPFDVLDVCKRMKIALNSYEDNQDVLSAMGLAQRCKQTDGFSVFTGRYWGIFYRRDYLSGARMNFVLLHEIGHILLGHRMKIQDSSVGVVEYSEGVGASVNRSIETEADMFAIRVCSPACVLKELGVRTPEEIMEICLLSQQHAKKRAKRMELLYQRDEFYKNPLEEQVRDQFMPFILQKRKRML